MLYTKSIHEASAAEDGLRILATRFRGRGLSSDRYDVWMASLGPSETLLRNFLAEDISWSEFSKRYRAELFAPSEVDSGNRTIRNHGQKFTLRLIKALADRQSVTLLCHCKADVRHCHRHLLKRVIESRRV